MTRLQLLPPSINHTSVNRQAARHQASSCVSVRLRVHCRQIGRCSEHRLLGRSPPHQINCCLLLHSHHPVHGREGHHLHLYQTAAVVVDVLLGALLMCAPATL